MSTNPNRDNDQMQEILRKIEQESAEKKRQEALKILNRNQTTDRPIVSWWQKLTQSLSAGVQNKKKEFIKQARVSQNKHLAIVSLFFAGAVWVSWAIEDKYDKIRARARDTKSQKVRQAEVENEYIKKMLARNPFEPVPIEQQQNNIQNYIYQKADIQFDTSADLIEVLEDQKRLLGQDDEPQP